MEMELLSVPQFRSKDEEARYWMNRAHRLHEKQQETHRELEEYQENSIILEQELETSYEQSMGKNRELLLSCSKLTQDNEELKVRLSEQGQLCAQLQCKLQEMESVVDVMNERVRKLEQENDDLERANRQLKGSEEAMEDQLNEVIEKLALVETEVEEKEGLSIMVQRLKDENTDLKNQIEADLRKTQGSPLTRLRRLSIVNRQRRNSAEIEKRLSVHEKIGDFSCDFEERQSKIDYVHELEKEVNYLKNNQRSSKTVIIDVASQKTTFKTDFSHQSKQDEDSMDSNEDQPQEVQVRLRSPRGISVDLVPRPMPMQSRALDENPRALTVNRATRLLECRAKKVKDEAKRQNLLHFLKRFSSKQPRWMGKRH